MVEVEASGVGDFGNKSGGSGSWLVLSADSSWESCSRSCSFTKSFGGKFESFGNGLR